MFACEQIFTGDSCWRRRGLRKSGSHHRTPDQKAHHCAIANIVGQIPRSTIRSQRLLKPARVTPNRRKAMPRLMSAVSRRAQRRASTRIETSNPSEKANLPRQQPESKPKAGALGPKAGESVASGFPIVGVGASAGGLEAFTRLLKHLWCWLRAAINQAKSENKTVRREAASHFRRTNDPDLHAAILSKLPENGCAKVHSFIASISAHLHGYEARNQRPKGGYGQNNEGAIPQGCRGSASRGPLRNNYTREDRAAARQG